jgi:hypothetical protein
MGDLLKLVEQPLGKIMVVLALAGALALIKAGWSFLREQILPAAYQWRLQRRKLTLPRAEAVLDKGSRRSAFFRAGGPKFIDFADGRVFTRPELNVVRTLLRQSRFVHVLGAPACGKSVLSLHIAYQSLQEGQTVYYYGHPSMIPTDIADFLRSPFARRLDRASVLMIVDDVHLDLTAASQFFSFIYSELSDLRLLFISRPISRDNWEDEDRVAFSFIQYMERVEITADIATGAIADFYSMKRFGHQMPLTTKHQFLHEAANDLLILGRYLAEWDGRPVGNLIPIRERVFAAVIDDLLLRKQISPDAVQIYLVLGLFYRFEIPVDVKLFKSMNLNIYPLIKSADIQVDNDYARLYHSSLGRLYSNAIEHHRPTEYDDLVGRFGPIPIGLFRYYITQRPRNLCEFIVGLRRAPEILPQILAEPELDPHFRWAFESEIRLTNLGWALLVLFAVSKSAGWRILENVDMTRYAVGAVERADGGELSLFLFNMKKVSQTKGNEWISAVPAPLLANRITQLRLRELSGTLISVQQLSKPIASSVSRAISADVFCEKFMNEDRFDALVQAIDRLGRLLGERVDIKVSWVRDFAGEWSTQIAFYCDNRKRFRIFRGQLRGLPFSQSPAQHQRYTRYWFRKRKANEGIVVDDGAARAITRGRSSLFAAGVCRVTGKFAEGDVIEVRNLAGSLVGAGITNFSSDQMVSIMGRKTSDVDFAGGVPNRVFDNDWFVHGRTLERLLNSPADEYLGSQ